MRETTLKKFLQMAFTHHGPTHLLSILAMKKNKRIIETIPFWIKSDSFKFFILIYYLNTKILYLSIFMTVWKSLRFSIVIKFIDKLQMNGRIKKKKKNS